LLALLALAGAVASAPAERIKYDGRLLGLAPTVSLPAPFNTPEADAVVAALQIMPTTHPWNERVDQRPLLANSAAVIAQITADLASNRRTLRPFFEMNYVLVPDTQPAQPIRLSPWPDERSECPRHGAAPAASRSPNRGRFRKRPRSAR
jgi:hypothetical protein